MQRPIEAVMEIGVSVGQGAEPGAFRGLSVKNPVGDGGKGHVVKQVDLMLRLEVILLLLQRFHKRHDVAGIIGFKVMAKFGHPSIVPEGDALGIVLLATLFLLECVVKLLSCR